MTQYKQTSSQYTLRQPFNIRIMELTLKLYTVATQK